MLGAWPLTARPYRVLVPVRMPWFEADQADVRQTAFTIEGMALIPASLAAMTNGLCAAVPDLSFSRLSLLDTNMPTMRTAAT